MESCEGARVGHGVVDAIAVSPDMIAGIDKVEEAVALEDARPFRPLARHAATQVDVLTEAEVRRHRATAYPAVVGVVEVPFAVVVDKHRAVDVAPQVARLVREGTGRALAGEQVVTASAGRGAHVEEPVPIDDFGGVGHGRRLVGTANEGLRPLDEVFCPPAVDVAVACADVQVVVTSVLHHVGVAEATVLQAGQHHRIGPGKSAKRGKEKRRRKEAEHKWTI